MFNPSAFSEGLGLRLAKVEIAPHDGADDEDEEHILPIIDETTPLILPTDEDWLLGGDEADEETVEAPARREGVLGLWELVGIIYFATSGGPEGTEGMVSSGGGLFTIAGILIMALLWSVPIALMAAELGTSVPENGGPMVWSRAAWGAGTSMGDAVAFLSGWMSFLFSAVDAALYPSMFVSYLTSGMGVEVSANVALAIELAFICVLVAHNCLGVASVGESSWVMIVVLLLPFTAFCFVAFSGFAGWPFAASNWLKLPDKPDYFECIVMLLWNMGMWESAAACAGEVKDPIRTFPRALFISVCIVVLNYALPIMAFTAVDNNFASYQNGYYIEIARKLGGTGFACAMALGQCVSTLGLFTNSIVKNSYTLCGMGEQTLLPRVFASRWQRTNAPLFSIGMSAAVTVGMVMISDFKAILGVDMFFYCVVLLIELASFFKLRYSYPDLPRGYRVPFRGALLVALFTPCAFLALFVACITPPASLLVAGVLILIGFLEYACVWLFRSQSPGKFEQHATAVPDLLETPACSRLHTPAPSVAHSLANSISGSVTNSRMNTPAHSVREGSIVGSSPMSSAVSTPRGSMDREPSWLSALQGL